MMTKYIDSNQILLEAYSTELYSIQFYFPKAGKFEHQASNISENFIVTAKSSPKEIIVGKKRVIK